jgi:hypothetical protein
VCQGQPFSSKRAFSPLSRKSRAGWSGQSEDGALLPRLGGSEDRSMWMRGRTRDGWMWCIEHKTEACDHPLSNTVSCIYLRWRVDYWGDPKKKQRSVTRANHVRMMEDHVMPSIDVDEFRVGIRAFMIYKVELCRS